MTPTAFSKTDLAAWRTLIERPEGSELALCLFGFGLSALVMPFALHRELAILFCVLAIGLSYILSHSFSTPILLALPAGILYLMSQTPAFSALLLATLLGTACCAVWLLHRHTLRGIWPVAAVQLAAYLLPVLVRRDFAGGLLSLLPLLLGFVFFLAVWCCTPQTRTLCRGASALAAFAALALVVGLLCADQPFGNPLLLVADVVREVTLAVLKEMRAFYAEAGIPIALSDVAIGNAAAMLVNLIPGIFLVLCTVVAYLAYRLVLRFLLGTRSLLRLPVRLSALTMSTFSAGLFLLSYIASLIANREVATIFGVVTQNLALVLEPGLALVGFGLLIGKGQPRSCFSYLLAFGLLFVMWNAPLTGLVLAAFFGALNILAAKIFSLLRKKGE